MGHTGGVTGGSMTTRQRARIIEALNALTGRSDCTEITILQRRSNTLAIVLIGALLAVGLMTTTIANLSPMASGALMGFGAAMAMLAATNVLWLARYGDDIVLAKASKMQRSAQEIVAEYPYPVSATIGSGTFNANVTVDGQEYLVHKRMLDQFREVTGAP